LAGRGRTSVRDREALRAFFSQNGSLEAGSFAEQRARFEALGGMFPVPECVEVEPATVGGVKGDWVRARRARRDAVLLYLHGGGYAIGSPKSHRSLLAQLSIDTGLSVFAPDYRLAPEHPFPAVVDDSGATYKGLLEWHRRCAYRDWRRQPAVVSPSRRSSPRDKACRCRLVVLLSLTDLTLSGESPGRARRDPIVAQPGIGNMAKACRYHDAKTPLISPRLTSRDAAAAHPGRNGRDAL
jgi:hypothetical protein